MRLRMGFKVLCRKTKLRGFSLLCPAFPLQGLAGTKASEFLGTQKHNLPVKKQRPGLIPFKEDCIANVCL